MNTNKTKRQLDKLDVGMGVFMGFFLGLFLGMATAVLHFI